jgi:hypothetical protein
LRKKLLLSDIRVVGAASLAQGKKQNADDEVVFSQMAISRHTRPSPFRVPSAVKTEHFSDSWFGRKFPPRTFLYPFDITIIMP